MKQSFEQKLCNRVRQVRIQHAGERGKSRFSKELGLSPSTYDYYERGRVPPAGVLVRIAEIAHVDLRWLLTGEAQPGESGAPAKLNRPGQKILQRAAKLMADHPRSAESLVAFLDLLEQALALPGEDWVAGAAAPPAVASSPPDHQQTWVPVLGRSAAGVPAFWADASEPLGLTSLADLIERHAESSESHEMARCDFHPSSATEPLDPHSVQLITLRVPSRDGGPVEFLQAESVRQRYPGCFALRIDGDSMSPEIAHGDLVLLSPTEPAQPGRAAVVQVRNAVGVTCKLYQPRGGEVRLEALNPEVGPIEIPCGDVDWALRVLGCIRPAATSVGRA